MIQQQYRTAVLFVVRTMDMGIIAATKRYYRKRLLSVWVSTMSATETLRNEAKIEMISGTIGLAEGHPAHILDASELLDSVVPYSCT